MVLTLAIKNADGTDYFAIHPNVYAQTCAVFKEDGSYANANGGDSWETIQNTSFLTPSLPIEYVAPTETATGVDITKIFYVKLYKDMDTLKVVYRQKHECFDLDKFEAYYNGCQ